MNDTKKEILTKSLQLFLQKSYKEVTMREIVDQIGLTKGAVYHHFTSKEEIFEEAVRYFYSHAMITDYQDFPTTSLFDFYNTYLDRIYDSCDDPNAVDEDNVFAFLSEAMRRIPTFLDIHHAQKKKEIKAWSDIVELAKEKKEIRTELSSEDIAIMFLDLSDGVALNKMIEQGREIENFDRMKRNWNGLYKLLQTNKG